MWMLLAAFALAPPSQLVPPAPMYVSFASPARLPGVILEPSTYIFAAGRELAGQMVVDVYRADGSALVASVLAVESSLRPGAGSLLDYPNTSPVCLRAWFHPSLRHGYEFVYPPAEAAAIHTASGESVPSAVFRGGTSVPGLLSIDHIGVTYRAGWEGVQGSPADTGDRPEGPVDQLTLARVEVLAHLHEVPPDIETRLRLLNHQLAALQTAYWLGRDDLLEHLSIVNATIDNSMFPDHRDVRHAIERVRERVRLFAEVLR